jgi:hypothetical protein
VAQDEPHVSVGGLLGPILGEESLFWAKPILGKRSLFLVCLFLEREAYFWSMQKKENTIRGRKRSMQKKKEKQHVEEGGKVVWCMQENLPC